MEWRNDECPLKSVSSVVKVFVRLTFDNEFDLLFRFVTGKHQLFKTEKWRASRLNRRNQTYEVLGSSRIFQILDASKSTKASIKDIEDLCRLPFMFSPFLLLLSANMLVLLIGRKPENLQMIATSLKDEDFDMIVWSGMGEDYQGLKDVCSPQKPDLVCLGDGMPPELRAKILEKLSKEYEDFNLPELPKNAYLRHVGPEEKPDVIKAIMQSGDEAKIQEIKDKKLGPFGTPQFIIDSVTKHRSGDNE